MPDSKKFLFLYVILFILIVCLVGISYKMVDSYTFSSQREYQHLSHVRFSTGTLSKGNRLFFGNNEQSSLPLSEKKIKELETGLKCLGKIIRENQESNMPNYKIELKDYEEKL